MCSSSFFNEVITSVLVTVKRGLASGYLVHLDSLKLQYFYFMHGQVTALKIQKQLLPLGSARLVQ